MKPDVRVELRSGQTGVLIKVIRSELGPRWDRAVIRLDDDDGELLPINPIVRFLAEFRVVTPAARSKGL